MLNTERDNWFVNMLITLSIATSFVLVMLLKDGFMKPFVVYIDQIIVIVVVLLTIYVPIKSIKEGLRELLLFGAGTERYQRFEYLVKDTLKEYPKDHIKVFLLKVGRKFWITLYLKPMKKTIATSYIEEIKSKISQDIQVEFPVHDVELIIKNDLN